MHSHDLDETWRVSPLLLCAELEAGCYLICACLTICRPLMERFFNSKIVQSLKSFVSSSSTSKVGTSYPTADSRLKMAKQLLETAMCRDFIHWVMRRVRKYWFKTLFRQRSMILNQVLEQLEEGDRRQRS
jgi:hypothetical protein